MKAIIEVSKRGAAIRSARQQISAAGRRRTPDYRLSFESARLLFSEFTPARLELLDTLRRVGPCSVYALAKAAERKYSDVRTDVSRLEELGLIERGKKVVLVEAHRIGWGASGRNAGFVAKGYAAGEVGLAKKRGFR